MKRFLLCAVVVLCAVIQLAPTLLFAQTGGTKASGTSVGTTFAKVGATLDFNSGYARLDGRNLWQTLAGTNVSVSATGSNNLKAYLDAGLTVVSVPGTSFYPATYLATATLGKAYFKLRFPLGETSSVKLNIGKQPFSMGYGLYYNAADLLFGADPAALVRSDTGFRFTSAGTLAAIPATGGLSGASGGAGGTSASSSGGAAASSSASGGAGGNQSGAGAGMQTGSATNTLSGGIAGAAGLSDVRGLTDWLANAQFSFNDTVAIDLLALPPIDTALNSESGRFGGMVTYRADAGFLESVQVACLSQGNLKKIQASCAFDGTLWLDYNLCSSVTFAAPAETASASAAGNAGSSAASGDTDHLNFDKDAWNVSLALCKIFSIQTDTANHNLTARLELLSYPVTASLNALTHLSYDLTDKTALSAYYLFAAPKLAETDGFTHTVGTNLAYTPLGGVTLSLTGVVQVGQYDHGQRGRVGERREHFDKRSGAGTVTTAALLLGAKAAF